MAKKGTKKKAAKAASKSKAAAAKKTAVKKKPAAKKSKPTRRASAKAITSPADGGNANVMVPAGSNSGALCYAAGTSPSFAGYTLVEIRGMVVPGQNSACPQNLMQGGTQIQAAQNWSINGIGGATGGGNSNTLWIGYRFVKMGMPPSEITVKESVSFTGDSVSTCP